MHSLFRSILLQRLLITYSISQETSDGISVQDYSAQAVTDYFDEKYEQSIKGFEKALIHYRMLKIIDINCGMRCISPNISKELEMNFDGFEELRAYGNLLAQANCVKICKEEHPFTKSKIERPRDDFVRDFEKRLPYNYLQFAYFKTGRIQKACQAAHTFLQANPGDSEMQHNVDYYKDLDEVSDDFFVDLEGKPYHGYFQNGVRLYEDGNYAEAIDNLENALTNYFDVLDECRSLCYLAKPPSIFHGLSQSISARYIPAFECTLRCDEKLRPVVRDAFVNNLVAKTYAYLQFAYYQLDKWELAVPSAASALLLDPNDEVPISNMKYYTENAESHGLKPEIHFQPRPEAVTYQLELKTTVDILDLMRKSVDYEDEMEAPDEGDDLKDNLLREISKQVVMQLGNKLRGDTG